MLRWSRSLQLGCVLINRDCSAIAGCPQRCIELRRMLRARCSGDPLPPSPPAEKATARQDHAGKSRTGDGGGNSRRVCDAEQRPRWIAAPGARASGEQRILVGSRYGTAVGPNQFTSHSASDGNSVLSSSEKHHETHNVHASVARCSREQCVMREPTLSALAPALATAPKRPAARLQ